MRLRSLLRGTALSTALCAPLAALPITAALTLAPALAPAPAAAQEITRGDSPTNANTNGTAPQTDKGFIESKLQELLSDAGRQVTVTGFAGALSSQASLQSLTIADDDGIWLTLEDVTLNWNRAALLRGSLDVTELSAARLIIARPPASQDLPEAEASQAAGTGFALPDLPVSVLIEKLNLAQVQLGAPLLGEAAQFAITGKAALAGGEGSATLSIDRQDRQGQFRLAGAYANASRQLDLDLSLDEPEGGIAARLIGLPGEPALALTVKGSDPLSDFTADLTLSTQGQPRLAGQVTLRETPENMPEDTPEHTPADGVESRAPEKAPETAPNTTAETGTNEGSDEGTEGGNTAAAPRLTRSFAADISGDLAPVFSPDYRPFFGDDIRLIAAGQQDPDGRITLDRLSLAAQSLRLTGKAAISADGWPEQFDLQGQISPPEGAQDVLLPLGEAPTRLQDARLSLSYDAAQGDGFAGRVIARGLTRPDLALARSELTLTGTLTPGDGAALGALGADIALAASGLVMTDPDLARAIGDRLIGDLRLDWAENAPLRLSDIALQGADYALTGAASAEFSADPFNLTLPHDLTLAAQDLGRFAPLLGLDLSGAARLSLRGKAEPLTGLIDTALSGETRGLALGIAQLDPFLQGTGQLALGLLRDAAGTEVQGLTITTPAAAITGKARLRGGLEDGASDAQLRLDLSDLAPLDPRLSGPGSVTLNAQQSGALWQAQADLSAPGETHASLAATLSPGADSQPLDATLSARIGRLSAWAGLAGQPLSGAAQLDANVTASLADLSGKADVTLRGQSLGLGQSTADTLLSGASKLELSARRDAAGLITIDRLDFDAPGVSADITGTTDGASTALTLAAQMGDLGRIAPGISGPASISGTARSTGQNTGQTTGSNWRLDLSGQGPAGIRLTTSGTLAADASRAALDISGTAPLALANGAIAPRSLSGFADFDLSLNGPLSGAALQSLSGRITTRQARLAAPGLRLTLQDIAAAVTLAAGRAQLDISAALASGGGLSVSGPVALAAPYDAALTARLNALQLQDPELYQTSLSGDLRVNGPLAGGARISGRIDLGETNIRVPSGGGAGYAGLPGLKHRNEPYESRRSRDWAGLLEDGSAAQANGDTASGPAYPLDVVIAAPARIFVRGRGLDAELGGQLRVTGTTADVRPIGRFDLIRGRFDVLGKRFDLTEARAQLQGALDPWLRFVAETEAQGSTVRIILEGPASDPSLSFESSPPLPPDEVLSLILFERDVTQISALQAVRLAAALRTLSGQGGEGLVGNLRSSLALDDLDVTTAEDGTTEARIGKYISDKVYTDVTVNSEGDSQIELNLQVTPRLKLRGRATSEGETGIGIYFEKDY